MNLPFLDGVYEQVTFDRELVFRFFTVFSLFEYALKQSGYLRDGEDAEPNWDRFAEAIEAEFYPNQTEELRKAVDYLARFPPKKQVAVEGGILFRAAILTDRSITKKLSIYIRRVRNNLFHGGKFKYDTDRDSRLIECALIVLEAWAVLDEKVKMNLENVV